VGHGPFEELSKRKVNASEKGNKRTIEWVPKRSFGFNKLPLRRPTQESVVVINGRETGARLFDKKGTRKK